MRSVVRQLSLAVALVVSVAGFVGCSSQPSSGTGDSASTGGALQIVFPSGYSAYDGTHDFKLPASVGGVTGVKWSASDPTLVDIEVQDNGSDVMMTMKGAGTVTITAQSGSLSGSETLTIRKADPSEYDDGKARYNDGVLLSHGKQQSADPNDPNFKRPACTNCHGDGAGHLDVQHSPTQTGGYSDDDLVKIMTTGTKPPGVPQRVMAFAQWHQIHQWNMTPEEQTGLITYLRALTPESQGPTVDFGGHGGGWRDGGAGGGGSGAGQTSTVDAGH